MRQKKVLFPCGLACAVGLLLSTAAQAQVQMRRPLTGNINAQANVNLAAQNNGARFGPLVMNLDSPAAGAANQIQPDWDNARRTPLVGVARFAPAQEKQQLMSANGISPMGAPEVIANIGHPYKGPNMRVSFYAGYSMGVIVEDDPANTRTSLLGGKNMGSNNHSYNAVLDMGPNAGGALLDCAVRSQSGPTLLAASVSRLNGNAAATAIGTVTSPLPAQTNTSILIPIKKALGSSQSATVNLYIPATANGAQVEIRGCTVTPLS